MSEVLSILKQEMAPFKDSLVLDGFKVVMLVDVVDGDDDLYWVYKDTKRGVYWSSCVGGFIPLKGIIDQSKYDRLLDRFTMNYEINYGNRDSWQHSTLNP